MARLMLPFPPPELRANLRAGAHWSASHAAKKRYALSCLAVIKSYNWGPVVPGCVPLLVVAHIAKGQRSPDLSDLGFWVKTAIDVLVEEGVFENDSPRYLNPFVSTIGKTRVATPGVELVWGEDAKSAIKELL